MVTALRTIPIRLRPVEGESFESWLWAYAHILRVKPAELMAALGLTHPPSQTVCDYTVRLLPSELDDLAAVTDFDPDTFRAMTLERYSERVLLLREDMPRCMDRFRLWVRPTGTRFCPKCLAETDGRWQLVWRLSWTFACLKHRCLLVDRCPSCDAIPRGYQGVGYLVDPGCCTARLAGQPRSARCRADLTRSRTPTLRAGHRVLRAQEWLNTLIEGPATDTEVREALTDLSAIVGRIFTQRRTDLLYGSGKRFGEAFAAAEQSGGVKLHRSTFPVVDSTLTAGALTVAVEVLDTLGRGCTSHTLESIVDRDDVTRWSTSPSNYFAEWNFGSNRLRTAVMQAHTARFTNVDGLRYRVATKSARFPRRTPELSARHTKIPQMCWRNIALALNPGILPHVFRPALSVALLLPGNPQRDLSVLAAKLDMPATKRTSVALRHLKQHTGSVGAEAICALADYLDSIDPVIDYQRRRRVIGPCLLPDRTWARICRKWSIDPGAGARARLAHCYLYARLTGNSVYDAPKRFRLDTAPRRTALANFTYHMSVDCIAALDDYAREYLIDRGIDDEPIIWEPPFDLIAKLTLPGPAVDSIDWRTLHSLIESDDPCCEELARRLGTNSEHIRCLLIEHPPLPKPSAPRTVASDSARYLQVQSQLTSQVLADLATEGCTSMRSIAARTGISQCLVARRIRELALPIRPPGGQAQLVVDKEWLRQSYIDDRRTLRQIAAELHSTPTTIRRYLTECQIPARQRGGGSHMEAVQTRMRASDYPEPLSLALTGEGAWTRLRRLDALMTHRSFHAAAAAEGTHEGVLSTQLARLERETRCRLLERSHASDSVVPTERGAELLGQYRRYRYAHGRQTGTPSAIGSG
ncbi:hypothetical protein ABIC28_001602 [Rhodococcus sp. PvR044]|uniref:TniQ family protein n=1 Tax=Rhodococcus sp. PvR044 TaxID=3156402 RepID=UPI0033965675